MTEAQKWQQYDAAKLCVDLLIGHYAALIYQAEDQENPDPVKVAELEQKQSEIIDVQTQLSLQITVEDQAAIQEILTIYEPMAKAALACNLYVV
jgi:hypothetical protein